MAGSAVMMDAMRILKAVGAKPRRTIRIALWGGEEEGLLGSKAYVKEHLVDSTTKAVKPEYQNLVAYYNLDNGTGRIRGVWLQDNLAIAPIFRTWFQSVRDLDVPGTIAPRSAADASGRLNALMSMIGNAAICSPPPDDGRGEPSAAAAP